jgi:glucokinase
LKGSTDIFGEIGHTMYQKDGELCKCGSRGCLETVAGISSIERTYSIAVEKHSGNKKASLKDIAEAAAEGDKTAYIVLKEAAEAIGYTLANAVNVLGVLDIFLYGPLTIAQPILKYHIQDALNARCLYPLNQAVKVHFSKLDDFSTAAGAAWYSLNYWYDHF